MPRRPPSPLRRFFYLAMGAMLIAFAYLQLDDPDPLTWILAYGYAGMTSLFAALNFPVGLVVSVGTIAYAAGLIATGLAMMTAYKPELLNEFGGLVVCLALMMWLFRQRR